MEPTRWCGGLIALGLALAPAGAQADPFRLILTHLEPPLVPNSVMDLALELGYFERAGVDVELVRVQQTPSALAAIEAGEGEMANIGVDALLLRVAQGVDDLKAVASPNTSLPFLIAARDDITAPADLSGRSFAVGRLGSLDHALSMNVLADAGVDTDALDIVALGQPSVRAQALAAGRVDATTMSIGVWLSLPDTNDLRILIDQQDYFAAAPVVNKVNIVPQTVLEVRGDEVEAVLRALLEISRDFADHPDLWADAMAPYAPELSPADLSELARSFDGSWSVNGGLDAEALEFTQEWLLETEDFAGIDAAPLDIWVDFGPLDRVLEEAGVDARADMPGR